jgi:hypothetical protein
MLGRFLVLVSLILATCAFAADAFDSSSVTMNGNTVYSGYSNGYTDSGKLGSIGSPNSGIGQASSDSLMMYKEFFEMDQGTQAKSSPVQSGAIQFNLESGKPSYLIINGQSKPYDPYYIQTNSFWIQGRNSWTQYIMCPMNARFSMLAYSRGGPTTVVETYPNGYQSVNQHYFYAGYTQLVFLADAVGRHTLTFYSGNQPSNSVIVDVVPYSSSYTYGNVPQSGLPPYGQILIDSQDAGFNPNAGPGGYGEPGSILIDSAYDGFDPTAPVTGEVI